MTNHRDTAGGKNRFGSAQRNALTALWREFYDDNSQDFTYHLNKLNTDNLDKLYNFSPIFTAVDKEYFNINIRTAAQRFATDLELEGARAQAAPCPREFLFYSTQYYCRAVNFLSHNTCDKNTQEIITTTNYPIDRLQQGSCSLKLVGWWFVHHVECFIVQRNGYLCHESSILMIWTTQKGFRLSTTGIQK